MSITLEQIEMLRERANVTYAEAKEVLEKCNGDIVEAMIMLEGQAKVRAPQSQTYHSHSGQCKGFFHSAKKILSKCNTTKFVIKKGDNTLIDIPVTLLLIFTVAALPLTAAGLLLALVTGHKFRFVKPDGSGVKINQTFDKMSSCVNSVSDQVKDAFKDEK